MKSVRIQLAVVLAATIFAAATLLSRGPAPTGCLGQVIFCGNTTQIRRGVSWYAFRSGSEVTGESALHVAAIVGSEAAIAQLIDRGDNVNARTWPVAECWGRGLSTPLHWAVNPPCGPRSLAACKSLVAAGADVHARDEGGRTPLFYAGSREIAEWLVEECHADPACRDNSGFTPLHFAAWNARDDVITYLAGEVGADINALADNGETPLHCASFVGFAKAGDALLLCGADVHAVDNAGATAVHRAASRGDVRAIHRLVRAGADLYAADARGRTVLHYLVSEELYDAHKAAGINVKPACWKTYPPDARGWSQANAAGMLIVCGVDFSARDADGKLAIDYCSDKKARDYLAAFSARYDPLEITKRNPLADMSDEEFKNLERALLRRIRF